jgi:hypothetical protein
MAAPSEDRTGMVTTHGDHGIRNVNRISNNLY